MREVTWRGAAGDRWLSEAHGPEDGRCHWKPTPRLVAGVGRRVLVLVFFLKRQPALPPRKPWPDVGPTAPRGLCEERRRTRATSRNYSDLAVRRDRGPEEWP